MIVADTVLLMVLSSFMFINRSGNRLTNRILGAYLLIHALDQIGFMPMHFMDAFLPDQVHWFHLGLTFNFSMGPLLFFYTKSALNPDFRFRKPDALHFIPNLLFILLMFPAFHFQPAEVKVQMVSDGFIMWDGLAKWLWMPFYATMLSYSIAAILKVRHYSSTLSDFARGGQSLHLRLLNVVLYGFAAMWLIDLVNMLINGEEIFGEISYDVLNYVTLTVVFGAAWMMLYIGLNFQEVVIQVAAAEEEERAKYESSTLTTDEAQSYLDALQQLMETEKIFRDPNVKLADIAEKLNIQERHLSQIVNEHIGTNFKDYLNGLRIDEAKTLLSLTNGSSKTVLEVLYEAGFNSKSVFNRTFKKHTGMTPTEFKKGNSE